MKKIILITLLLVILGAVSVFLYFLFFYQSDPNAEPRSVRDFLPFGDREVEEPRDSTEDPDFEEIDTGRDEEEGRTSRLAQVSHAPVARGGIAFYREESIVDSSDDDEIVGEMGEPTEDIVEEDESEEVLYVRYVERQSGNIYEMNTDTLEETQLTSSISLPVVHRSHWVSPNEVVVQYFDNDEALQTVNIEIEYDDEGARYEEYSLSLPDNISQVVLNPTESRMFSLFANEGRGIISTPRGGRQTVALSSEIREWQIGWPRENTITLTTSPTFDVPGSMFLLNPNNGTQRFSLTEIPGLTTTTGPDVAHTFYTEGTSDGIESFVFEHSNGNRYGARIDTLPSKCEWSRMNPDRLFCGVPEEVPDQYSYPDHWYQGRVFFTDSLYQLDLSSNSLELLHDDLPEDIDAIELFFDENEEFLFFVNKRDMTLWMLELNEDEPEEGGGETEQEGE